MGWLQETNGQFEKTYAGGFLWDQIWNPSFQPEYLHSKRIQNLNLLHRMEELKEQIEKTLLFNPNY